jgi:hypothetical protein
MHSSRFRHRRFRTPLAVLVALLLSASAGPAVSAPCATGPKCCCTGTEAPMAMDPSGPSGCCPPRAPMPCDIGALPTGADPAPPAAVSASPETGPGASGAAILPQSPAAAPGPRLFAGPLPPAVGSGPPLYLRLLTLIC